MLLLAFFTLMAGCQGSPRHYTLSVSHNNLSDSYLYPYYLSVNEDGGFPGGGLKKCSDDVRVNSLAQTSISGPPQDVTIEWQHILSGKYYRAKVPLDKRINQWLRESPFDDADSKHSNDASAIIVQWRGEKRVAVMLVANFTDFSKGKIDIGEAEGIEVQKPERSYRISPYSMLNRKPGDDYFPGRVRNYERSRDGTLSREQRFGCPRDANGRVDESRLPPAKLPFITGANGEYIPCDQYFCADKQELRNQLENIGWKNYPMNGTPPEITFHSAPNPKPAW
jgi:hypothetical protein